MKTLSQLIDLLGWANLASESKEIFKRLHDLTQTFLADAPTDGTLYGRKDGTWTEVEAATPGLQPGDNISELTNDAGFITEDDLPAPSTLPYKLYAARLNQTDTNAPVPTIVYNNLGGVVTWGYQNPGQYGFGLPAGLSSTPANKIFIFTTPNISTNGDYTLISGFVNTGAGGLQVFVGSSLGVSKANDELVDAMIEIRVYD